MALQMGGMIAAILNQEFISNATKLDMNGNTATIERDIQWYRGFRIKHSVCSKCYQSVMAEAEFLTWRGIMAARTKP